jgi:3-methyladenine DNA glycosylase AlkD
MDPERAADEVEAGLRALGTPERAAGSRRYLKSQLDHLGATVGQNRAAVGAFRKHEPDLTHDELIGLVRVLWSREIFDLRLSAVLLLHASPGLLTAADLPLLHELVADSRTWALVDVLSVNVLGTLVLRQPEAVPELDAWAADEDFWVRRAALLSQLKPLGQEAEFARFGAYADAMLDETEFFIRKAIGWVLRETAKWRPDEVYAWLAPRTARASGVTMREAVKHLGAGRREELMRAHREKRAAA